MIAPCGVRGRKLLLADRYFMVSRALDGHWDEETLRRPLSWNKGSEGL